MTSLKTIAFYRAGLIGDNIVAIYAIYATKILYPKAKLIVYTNTNGMQLYANLDFIDEIIDINLMGGGISNELISHINSHNVDWLILTQSNRYQCGFAVATNAKKIATFLTFPSFICSLISRRFHTIFISRNFSKIPQYKRLLKLVRCTYPKLYDKSKFDFSLIKIKTNDCHKEYIECFLQSYHIQSPFVIINPFVQSTSHNLTFSAWSRLIEWLSKDYPHIYFVIPTYDSNPKIPHIWHSNVVIFHNNSDLLNLVELICRSRLVINPSTSSAHIANNLNIPQIFLHNKIDKYLWRGDNMNDDFFVELKRKTGKLSKVEEDRVIESVREKFAKIIKD